MADSVHHTPDELILMLQSQWVKNSKLLTEVMSALGSYTTKHMDNRTKLAKGTEVLEALGECSNSQALLLAELVSEQRAWQNAKAARRRTIASKVRQALLKLVKDSDALTSKLKELHNKLQ